MSVKCEGLWGSDLNFQHTGRWKIVVANGDIETHDFIWRHMLVVNIGDSSNSEERLVRVQTFTADAGSSADSCKPIDRMQTLQVYRMLVNLA
jgi:hypothetical protein